jgi:hypothetical protein
MEEYDTMKRFALGLVAVVAAAAFLLNGGWAFGEEKDPLVGTWVLDRGKSVFDPDTELEGRTIIFEAKGGGVSFVQKTVTAAGNTIQSDYVASYDGKDVPISGSQLDMVALKRTDANTVERTGKIGGKVAESATMAISNAGKTLTIATKGSFGGVDYSSTQVFDKR